MNKKDGILSVSEFIELFAPGFNEFELDVCCSWKIRLFSRLQNEERQISDQRLHAMHSLILRHRRKKTIGNEQPGTGGEYVLLVCLSFFLPLELPNHCGLLVDNKLMFVYVVVGA